MGLDSTSNLNLDFDSGGNFFVIQDNQAPRVRPAKAYKSLRRGERLIFKVDDNTGVTRAPQRFYRGTIDGREFFPDYNSLRKELSFHVPKNLGIGQHVFAISVRDKTGNVLNFTYPFTVKR